MVRIIQVVGIVLLALLGSCKKEQSDMPQSSFRFTVEEVFYIKPPVDRVILVGTVTEGKVRPGDSATVQCGSGPVRVVVEGIEGFKQGDIPEATKGQQVGLRLQGISKEQPSKGDQVVGGSQVRAQ